jgi:hypothetical protein
MKSQVMAWVRRIMTGVWFCCLVCLFFEIKTLCCLILNDTSIIQMRDMLSFGAIYTVTGFETFYLFGSPNSGNSRFSRVVLYSFSTRTFLLLMSSPKIWIYYFFRSLKSRVQISLKVNDKMSIKSKF